MSILFLGSSSLILSVLGYGLYNIQQKLKKLINSEFKIAHISDNMGASYYKIVGRESKDKDFIEVSKIPIVAQGFVSTLAVLYANNCYDDKNKAEKGLKKFLIHIGKVKYEREIKI